MKAFWIIIGILLALIFLGILDRIRKERELLQKVKSSFGIQPEDASMSSERYASLSAYMQSLSETECDIDEITWNDLDMDRIFTGLNHTCSAIGEEVLFAYLHKPEWQYKMSIQTPKTWKKTSSSIFSSFHHFLMRLEHFYYV